MGTRSIPLDDILGFCADEYGVTPEQVISKDRHMDIVDARALFCVVAWETGDYYLSAIGRFISRNHSTASYHLSQRARWHIGTATDREHYERVKNIMAEEVTHERPSYSVAYNTGSKPFTLSMSAITWLWRYGCRKVRTDLDKFRLEYEELAEKGHNDRSEEQFVSDRLMRYYNRHRHDKDLIGCINVLGREAGASGCILRVATINVPAYRIDTDDSGKERVKAPSERYTFIK